MKSAAGYKYFLALFGYVSDQFLSIFINHGRPHRNPDHKIIASTARAVSAHATLASLSDIATLEAKIDQGIQRQITDQIDTATITAITTIGAAFGDKFLPTKAHAAVAALAGFHNDLCFIYKLHVYFRPYKKAPSTDRALF
jgi:hypothetical protein